MMMINKSFVSADKAAHVMTQLKWPSLNHEQSGEQLQSLKVNQAIPPRDVSLSSARPLDKWLIATLVHWESSAKSSNNQRGLLKRKIFFFKGGKKKRKKREEKKKSCSRNEFHYDQVIPQVKSFE